MNDFFHPNNPVFYSTDQIPVKVRNAIYRHALLTYQRKLILGHRVGICYCIICACPLFTQTRIDINAMRGMFPELENQKPISALYDDFWWPLKEQYEPIRIGVLKTCIKLTE